MKLVTLCENVVEASFGLKAIHGFSLYLEFGQNKILYDVGQENVFHDNAEKLNIDLSKCDDIIISHGHFDHAGGLRTIDKDIGILPRVIISDKAFNKKIRKFGTNEVDIGVSEMFSNLKVYAQNIEKDFEIHKNIWIISNVDGDIFPEKELLSQNKQGDLVLDEFKDEISLAIITSKGLVIISGCSHCGINNILEKARKTTKVDKIYMVIGGLHTAFADERTKKQIVNKLKEYDISKIITGHCTGIDNINFLKEELEKTEIIMNYVGYKYEEEI